MEDNRTDGNKFWMLEKGGTVNNLRLDEINLEGPTEGYISKNKNPPHRTL